VNYPALLALTRSPRAGLGFLLSRRALQRQVPPQRAQSPQALLRSVPLLFLFLFLGARRNRSVRQRTLRVAFERYPCPSTSHGASRSDWNDERVEADRSERPS
jgi:hypothetical protein